MNTTLQKKQRRILTPTETQKFEEAVHTDKDDRQETEFTFPGESRQGIPTDEQMKRIQQALKDGKAETPENKREIAKLEKRAAVLKEWLQKSMVPKSHVRLRSQSGGVQDPEFRKAVDEMSRKEMSSEFQTVAQEFKNIMRTLGRHEDANLEYIRPDTR